MNFKKLALLPLVSLMFAACSDSSSTAADNTEQGQNNPTIETPSDPNADPTDPGVPSDPSDPSVPGDPSSTEDPSLNPTTPDPSVPPAPEAVPLTDADYDSVGVVDLGRALQSVAAGENVIIVLRHAERESMTGHESPLTEIGLQQSQQVGQKIPAHMTLTYHHTDYVRTEQTAMNIAIGHGQDTVGIAHDTIDYVKGSWFVKDGDLKDSYATKDTNSYGVLSLWVYEGLFADAFYDLKEKGAEMINKLVNDYTAADQTKLIVSHDDFVMPMMAYISDGKADFRYKRAKRWWVNYLVGFVVIIGNDGAVRSIPVKGLDSAVE